MMSYTTHSNTNNHLTFEENEKLLSFSFSLEEKQKATVEQLRESIKSNLQDILNSRFSDHDRRRIDNKINRFNFACPYCGDSHTDAHKKRGNIYTQSCHFKCYNCGKYRNIEYFLRDFDKELNTEELILSHELNATSKPEQRTMDPMVLHNVDNLLKWSISRTEIEEAFNLTRIDNSSIYSYLEKRLQPDLSRFSWNYEKQQLYIFHLIPNTDQVLGYQIRNFKTSPKYLTYKLSRIYAELNKDIEITEEILEIDEISTAFGILEIDISKPVTVFEGPLDSFLYKNSIATCSSNNESPIQLSTLRYMYDYDKAGCEAALAKINAGQPVFLWRKLLHDIKLDHTGKKIDLTDLLVLAKRKNMSLPKLSLYFSSDKYDAYWI